MGTLCIDSLSIGGNDVAHDVAHHVQHTVIRIHGIGHVLWCLVVLVFIGEVTLFQFHDALHQRTVLQFKLDFFNIGIIVAHIRPPPSSPL